VEYTAWNRCNDGLHRLIIIYSAVTLHCNKSDPRKMLQVDYIEQKLM
jgi:hypothetical protein